MNSDHDLPFEAVAEIAIILAKGYLRHRKSRRIHHLTEAEKAENGLDSSSTQSPHVSVVNAESRGESGWTQSS